MAGSGKKRPTKPQAEAAGKKPTPRRRAASDQPERKVQRSTKKAKGIEIDPERLALMLQIVEGARRITDAFQNGGNIADLMRRVGSFSPPVQTGALVDAVPLKSFLADIEDLTAEECEHVAEVAEKTLEAVYVHLPLKRALHAVDPIQRLRILRRRVRTRSIRAFHGEMLSIFHSLRDLHTNYILPSPYQGRTAFLPFLVEKCFEDRERKRPRFVVSKLISEVDVAGFKIGVALTHWNGVPIERAVEIVADREAGGNDDAREARGLEALTLRSLALTAPPDEEWVVIGFEVEGQVREARFEWMVFSPPKAPSTPPVAASRGSLLTPLGLDVRTEEIRRAKKVLFTPWKIEAERKTQPASTDNKPAQPPETKHHDPPSRSLLGQAHSHHKHGSAPLESPDQPVSLMPDVFEFREVDGPDHKLGYLRIFTFMVEDADAFVGEFIRIVKGLPQEGLILDVRGNGGGNILAGERLLQTLTPRVIEPSRLQFINTSATLELCNDSSDDLELKRWFASIGLSVESGEVYSQALPLQSAEQANQLGQQYQGPVILIVDALCYSTTDIFAAGFQDHKIGPILGTSKHTGAGGANVWEYGMLQESLPNRFPTLPGGTTFRVAVRRTIRIGDRSGVPVEDFGVEPDEVYAMTSTDVLGGNVDLIARAGVILATIPLRSLTAEVDASGLVQAHAKNANRVDVYQAGRPLGTGTVIDGLAKIQLPIDYDESLPLNLRGFDGEDLVTAVTITPGSSG